jgi:hypothetical protein
VSLLMNSLSYRLCRSGNSAENSGARQFARILSACYHLKRNSGWRAATRLDRQRPSTVSSSWRDWLSMQGSGRIAAYRHALIETDESTFPNHLMEKSRGLTFDAELSTDGAALPRPSPGPAHGRSISSATSIDPSPPCQLSPGFYHHLGFLSVGRPSPSWTGPHAATRPRG